MAQKAFYVTALIGILLLWGARARLPESAPVSAALTSGSSTITSQEKEVITLFFAGDVMPSRWVAKRMHEYGYDYPFREVRGLIQEADIAFLNLESPILPGRSIEGGETFFRTDPEFVPALKDAGVDVVSLANNHTPNFEEEGLGETFRYLEESGIAFIGAGKSARAYAPVFIEYENFVVAFVAQNDTDVIPEHYCASEERLGTACFDEKHLREAIREANSTADYVVFTMHAGDEYTTKQNERQTQFAHAAIDAGADLVIGGHPHVIQNKEEYKGKSIYYSLGNFIFDQEWSEETRTGLVLIVTIDRSSKEIVEIREIIVDIVDYAQPSPRETRNK